MKNPNGHEDLTYKVCISIIKENEPPAKHITKSLYHLLQLYKLKIPQTLNVKNENIK